MESEIRALIVPLSEKLIKQLTDFSSGEEFGHVLLSRNFTKTGGARFEAA